jgi:hypothetical protein
MSFSGITRAINPSIIMRKFALPVAANVPLAALAAACLALVPSLPLAAQPPDGGPGGNRFGGFGRRAVDTNDPVYRIREEGMNHSQAMETLSYLSDVIGPRLTGSPNMKHANEWTREKMESWGMANAHLEAWGPFGRGWSLERFSAQVIEPQNIPLKAFPSAWSPGLYHPVEGEVVFLDATNTACRASNRSRGVMTPPICSKWPMPMFPAPARRLATR